MFPLRTHTLHPGVSACQLDLVVWNRVRWHTFQRFIYLFCTGKRIEVVPRDQEWRIVIWCCHGIAVITAPGRQQRKWKLEENDDVLSGEDDKMTGWQNVATILNVSTPFQLWWLLLVSFWTITITLHWMMKYFETVVIACLTGWLGVYESSIF